MQHVLQIQQESDTQDSTQQAMLASKATMHSENRVRVDCYPAKGSDLTAEPWVIVQATLHCHAHPAGSLWVEQVAEGTMPDWQRHSLASEI